MERSDIVARLRLVAQEFEAGTLESIVVTSVDQEGQSSSLVWPGEYSTTLLGAMVLSRDTLSSRFRDVDKERTLE